MTGHVACTRENDSKYKLLFMRQQGRRSPAITKLKCYNDMKIFRISFWHNSSQWIRTFSVTKFLDHTQRRTTVGRTLLDGWSAQRRDLYLTTHGILNRHTSMPLVRFEPTISADERPQTHALDRAATGIGKMCRNSVWKCIMGLYVMGKDNYSH